MKWIFPAIFFLSLSASAQIEIQNLSLKDSSLKYFYVGVDNVVHVKPRNKNDEYLLLVEGAGASVEKIAINRFVVRVNVPETCKAILLHEEKVVYSEMYKCFTVSEGIPRLGRLRNTTATTQEILTNPFLTIYYPGCHFKINSIIVFFALRYNDGTGNISVPSKGSTLTTEQARIIRELRSGDKIYFEDIRAKGADDEFRGSLSFWLIIK